MKVKSFFKKKTAKIFGEDDSDMDQDDSDSDGYLSEDASCSYNGETESENHLKVICMQRTMVMVIYQSEQGNSFRTGTENDKVERLESQGLHDTMDLNHPPLMEIGDSCTFGKILTFMLHEAGNIFHEILGISCSNERKEVILELKNTSKWKTLKPLVKSYARRVGNLERTLAFLLRLSCQSIGLNLKTSRMNVFFSAIELLAVHCAQRSHHISFPDPKVIPIIHLSKIHEMTTIESLRHAVKRLLISSLDQKKSKEKRQQPPKKAMDVDLAVNGEGDSQ
ncbi:hypothetical protein Peur_017201 [Populus x canadensis]